jgi:hypothetical protein
MRKSQPGGTQGTLKAKLFPDKILKPTALSQVSMKDFEKYTEDPQEAVS